LQSISKDTFAETFAASNHPEDLKAYMDTAFDKATLQKELKNPQSMFAFIYQDAKLAGYLKINTEEAQTESRRTDGLELQRMNDIQAILRQRLGQRMLQYTFQQAEIINKSYIWLGV